MRENVRCYFVWAMQQDPSDLRYSHLMPFRKLLGGGIGCEGLSDDEAMYINEALSALKLENPEDFKVLQLVVRDGRSFRWLQHRGFGDRKMLASSFSQSLEFIRGFLLARLAA